MAEYVMLLQRALQVVVRNKALWVLGLIAVIVGQDAVFNMRGALRLEPLADVLVNLPLPYANLVRTVVPDPAGALNGLITLALGASLIVVGSIVNAALLLLTQAVERGDDVRLAAGLRDGLRFLWPLSAIRFILNLPAIVLALIALVIAADQPTVTLAVQAAGLLPVLLVLGVAAGTIGGAIEIGADRACVFDAAGVVDALQQGVAALRKNIGRYVAVTGIFIASLLMLILLAACPLAMALTDTLATLSERVSAGTDLTPLLLGTPIGLAAGILLVIAYAFFTAFASVVWTLVYRRYA